MRNLLDKNSFQAGSNMSTRRKENFVNSLILLCLYCNRKAHTETEGFGQLLKISSVNSNLQVEFFTKLIPNLSCK